MTLLDSFLHKLSASVCLRRRDAQLSGMEQGYPKAAEAVFRRAGYAYSGSID